MATLQPLRAYRQVELNDANSRSISLPVAGLRILPDEFERRFGITFVDKDLEDGLGPVKATLVETASKKRFGLVHYIKHPEPRGISVWTHDRSLDPKADLQDFMKAFN